MTKRNFINLIPFFSLKMLHYLSTYFVRLLSTKNGARKMQLMVKLDVLAG